MEPFLTSCQIRTFNEKKVEFGTPNRTYCHDVTCSAFIPPDLLSDILPEQVVTCGKCGKQTCTMCKGAGHELEDCPDDTAAQEVIRLAQENGWQRCFSCGRMVELYQGCNHITCPCKAEFCYVCGVRWKACDCPQWDETNLYARAAGIVIANREHRLADNVPQIFNRLVDEVRQDLRQDHECDHRRWITLHGQYTCDACNNILPTHIFQCRRCRTLACRRCRYNRL
ncbi:IBR finger domain-containing protein, partial [Metarhizium majus ARSEF 297]